MKPASAVHQKSALAVGVAAAGSLVGAGESSSASASAIRSIRLEPIARAICSSETMLGRARPRSIRLRNGCDNSAIPAS